MANFTPKQYIDAGYNQPTVNLNQINILHDAHRHASSAPTSIEFSDHHHHPEYYNYKHQPHPPPQHPNPSNYSPRNNSRPLSAASKTASIRSSATISSFLTNRTISTPDFSIPPAPEVSNIRVVVRIRPKTDFEISRENSPRESCTKRPTVNASDPSRFVTDDKLAISCLGDGKTLCLDQATTGNQRNISHNTQLENTASETKTLTFHRVYEEYADQEQVFNECGVKDLVKQAIKGYAATVFAFGQTGSGKTFTITGPEVGWNLYPDRLGIIPRALEYLFEELAVDQSPKRPQYTVRATYLEIYNELVQDLLSPLVNANASLPVRWTAERGFYVENTITVECQDLDDCMAVLEEGLKNRTTGAHRLNEYSSRSHSIMTVYIDSEYIDENDHQKVVKKGKISFVDLAGSERVRESRAKGDTLTETMNINKSLLTLGHIPYRDSNLTKLLSDSLGGSGLALMIACISPSSFNLQESLKTLRYAARARKIRNRPSIQVAPIGDKVLALRREVNGLRRENAALRAAVELRGDYNPIMNIRSGLSSNANASLHDFQPRYPGSVSGHVSPFKLPDISLSSAGSLCASRASLRGGFGPSPPPGSSPSPSPYLSRFLRSTSRASLEGHCVGLPPLAPSKATKFPAESTVPKSKIPTSKREGLITKHEALDSVKDAIPSKRNARVSRGTIKTERSDANSASSASSSQRRQHYHADMAKSLEKAPSQSKPKSPSTRESALTLTSSLDDVVPDPFLMEHESSNPMFPLNSLQQVATLKQMIANDVDALDREIDMLSSSVI
ncbi:P-loop containing nucleoside triphosphate hydrolase protein [Obelidium mucronatum]|nr:P-loop containing nucleoside triphosphate hydrolase protein [Obelidium mucronatum]